MNWLTFVQDWQAGFTITANRSAMMHQGTHWIDHTITVGCWLLIGWSAVAITYMVIDIYRERRRWRDENEQDNERTD
jgi:high-affinity nickel permease